MLFRTCGNLYRKWTDRSCIYRKDGNYHFQCKLSFHSFRQKNFLSRNRKWQRAAAKAAAFFCAPSGARFSQTERKCQTFFFWNRVVDKRSLVHVSQTFFQRRKNSPQKTKDTGAGLSTKKGCHMSAKWLIHDFIHIIHRKSQKNSRAGKIGFGTGVLWIMFRGKKKIEKCRTKWINEIVRKQFGLQNKKMELLQNSSIVWYNVHTIIQRKDDEYEIYYRW